MGKTFRNATLFNLFYGFLFMENKILPCPSDGDVA